MALTIHPDGSYVATGSAITLIQLMTLRRAVILEGLGMRISRGPSALARAKKQLDLPKSTSRIVALRHLEQKIAAARTAVENEPIICTPPKEGDTL